MNVENLPIGTRVHVRESQGLCEAKYEATISHKRAGSPYVTVRTDAGNLFQVRWYEVTGVVEVEPASPAPAPAPNATKSYYEVMVDAAERRITDVYQPMELRQLVNVARHYIGRHGSAGAAFVANANHHDCVTTLYEYGLANGLVAGREAGSSWNIILTEAGAAGAAPITTDGHRSWLVCEACYSVASRSSGEWECTCGAPRNLVTLVDVLHFGSLHAATREIARDNAILDAHGL